MHDLRRQFLEILVFITPCIGVCISWTWALWALLTGVLWACPIHSGTRHYLSLRLQPPEGRMASPGTLTIAWMTREYISGYANTT